MYLFMYDQVKLISNLENNDYNSNVKEKQSKFFFKYEKSLKMTCI